MYKIINMIVRFENHRDSTSKRNIWKPFQNLDPYDFEYFDTDSTNEVSRFEFPDDFYRRTYRIVKRKCPQTEL